MRRITNRLFAVILFVALAAGASVRGAEQNSPAESKPESPKSATSKPKKKAGDGSEKPPKGTPFHGQIAAVDNVNKTITIKGKEKDRTCLITSNTRLTKGGKPAVLVDAVVGDEVAGFWKESAAGKLEAVSIRFGAKDSGQAKPKKETKKQSEK